MADAAGLVSYRIDRKAARLTLDRPEESNRLTYAMMRQVIEGLRRAQDEADVLVIDAAGGDFTVGRDQTERIEGVTKRDNLALILEANGLLTGFAGVTVVAAQGRLRGFGAGLAVQSDITLLASDATVAFDEIAHGFAPTIVLTYLADAIGRKRAIELVSSGRVLHAEEAVAYALASRVAEGSLERAVDTLVDTLLGYDRDALRMCKRFVTEMPTLPVAERGGRALDALTS
jgi:methylglutaconyl-CoA hydratase